MMMMMMMMMVMMIPLNIKQFEPPSVEWYGGEDGPLHFFKHVYSYRDIVEMLLYLILSKLLD